MNFASEAIRPGKTPMKMNANLLSCLVEHLALRGKGVRSLHKVIQLLSALKNRLDCLMLQYIDQTTKLFSHCGKHLPGQSLSHPILVVLA